MCPYAMPLSTGSLIAHDPVQARVQGSGLLKGPARSAVVGPDASARSEHSVKGTHPVDSDAPWQASARGPESATATRSCQT